MKKGGVGSISRPFAVERTGCDALDPLNDTIRFEYISQNDDITGSMASVTVFPLLRDTDYVMLVLVREHVSICAPSVGRNAGV